MKGDPCAPVAVAGGNRTVSVYSAEPSPRRCPQARQNLMPWGMGAPHSEQTIAPVSPVPPDGLFKLFGSCIDPEFSEPQNYTTTWMEWLRRKFQGPALETHRFRIRLRASSIQ